MFVTVLTIYCPQAQYQNGYTVLYNRCTLLHNVYITTVSMFQKFIHSTFIIHYQHTSILEIHQANVNVNFQMQPYLNVGIE